MSIPDLWPESFGTSKTLPPLMILRGQAESLGKRTKGLVVGDVTISQESNDISLNMYLVVPALENYSYQFLHVRHPVEFYPIRIDYVPTGKMYRCASEPEFLDALKDCFTNERTMKVLQALIAQATEQSKLATV